jgi:hypothetical protein
LTFVENLCDDFFFLLFLYFSMLNDSNLGFNGPLKLKGNLNCCRLALKNIRTTKRRNHRISFQRKSKSSSAIK